RKTGEHREGGDFCETAEQEDRAHQEATEKRSDTAGCIAHLILLSKFVRPLQRRLCGLRRGKVPIAQAKSNSRTSDASFASTLTDVSLEMAAPSPATRSVPFTRTDPRAT